MRLVQLALIALISLSLMANSSDSAVAATSSKSRKSSAHYGQNAHGRSMDKKHGSKTSVVDVWDRIRLGIRIPRPSPASSSFDQIKVSTGIKSSIYSTQAINIPASHQAQNDDSTRLTTVIAPKKLLHGESQLPEKLRVRRFLMAPNGSQSKLDINSAEKYTRLGRLKLASKESSMLSKGRLTAKSGLLSGEKLQNESLFKSPSIQRIRTRLGLHPELFKNGDSSAMVASSMDKKTVSSSLKAQQHGTTITNCADLSKPEVINLAQKGLLPDSYSRMAEQCQIKQNAKYDRVNKHIAGYSQNKGFLYQSTERARPYLYHIVDTLSKHNLPMDLALLPIVESGYQPTALSPKSAAGIWQFIPSTGKEYGLQQNEYYDARLDVSASTHAAIRFLSGLKDHFKGDWLLALAAYNCGQGAVDAAIASNEAEGLDTDFWSLNLPAETQEYVPRLLALSTIFSNPGSYGLKLRPIKNEPYFIKINIDRDADINQLANKDLKTIAKLADFNTDEFGLLNSAYLKSSLTGSKPFALFMPISNANLLHQSLEFMAQSYKSDNRAASPFLHELALSSGDVNTKIQGPLLAVSLDEEPKWYTQNKPLKIFNGLSNSEKDETIKTKTDSNFWAVHYLDKGESLKAVAESHGISEETLREVNKFKRRQIIALGQRLLIPLKKVAALSIKRTAKSVLYRGMTGGFDPLHLHL